MTGDRPSPGAEGASEETFSKTIDRVATPGKVENPAAAEQMGRMVEEARQEVKENGPTYVVPAEEAKDGKRHEFDIINEAVPVTIARQEADGRALERQIDILKEQLAELEDRRDNVGNENAGKPLEHLDLNWELNNAVKEENEGLSNYRRDLMYAGRHHLTSSDKNPEELAEFVRMHAMTERAKQYGIDTAGKTAEQLEEEVKGPIFAEAVKKYGLKSEKGQEEAVVKEEIEARMKRGLFSGASLMVDFQDQDRVEEIAGVDRFVRMLENARKLENQIDELGLEYVNPEIHTFYEMEHMLEEAKSCKEWDIDPRGMNVEEMDDASMAAYQEQERAERKKEHTV